MHDQVPKSLLLDGLPQVNIRVVPALNDARHTFGGAFRLFQYVDHQPLVYLDGYFSGLFLEDPQYVEGYRTLIPVIANIALDERESREWLATLANDYDRQRADPDAPDRLEEKQL